MTGTKHSEFDDFDLGKLALMPLKRTSASKRDSTSKSNSKTQRSVNRLLNLYSENDEAERESSKEGTKLRKLVFQRFNKTTPEEEIRSHPAENRNYNNLLQLSDALLRSSEKMGARLNQKANTIQDLHQSKKDSHLTIKL